jgi:beta-mannosidase
MLTFWPTGSTSSLIRIVQLSLPEADRARLLDPFLNTNELAVRWIAEKSWIYRLEFSLPQIASPIPAFTDLVFEGLDTFATATLNGTVILESDNMHLHHSVPINNHLHREETNILEILFHSALLRGRELVKAHPGHQHFSRQTEDSCIPVRKAQYHWGWGWGPILMTVGPWRPIHLETYGARIEDVWTQYSVSPELTSVTGRLFACAKGAHEGSEVDLCLSIEGHNIFQISATIDAAGIAEALFSIEDVKLWSPLGYGSQHRYELSATLTTHPTPSSNASASAPAPWSKNPTPTANRSTSASTTSTSSAEAPAGSQQTVSSQESHPSGTATGSNC